LVTFRLHGKGVPKEMATLEIEAEGMSIGMLFRRVLGERPGLRDYLIASGELRTDITILVNGRHCMFMDGLETRLNRGDRIDVLLPMIGG